jgi:EF hand
MNPKLRLQRSAFLLFLGACVVALVAALPIVTAQTAEKQEMKKDPAAAGSTAAAPKPEEPDFERTDRNRDGVVDKSEAGVVPGLSANFERADRSRDGKLDREEFARGLQILQVRR